MQHRDNYRRFRHDNTTFCRNDAKCRGAGQIIPQSHELRRWRSLYCHDQFCVIAPSIDETRKQIKDNAQMKSAENFATETFTNWQKNRLRCR